MKIEKGMCLWQEPHSVDAIEQGLCQVRVVSVGERRISTETFEKGCGLVPYRENWHRPVPDSRVFDSGIVAYKHPIGDRSFVLWATETAAIEGFITRCERRAKADRERADRLDSNAARANALLLQKARP